VKSDKYVPSHLQGTQYCTYPYVLNRNFAQGTMHVPIWKGKQHTNFQPDSRHCGDTIWPLGWGTLEIWAMIDLTGELEIDRERDRERSSEEWGDKDFRGAWFRTCAQIGVMASHSGERGHTIALTGLERCCAAGSSTIPICECM